MGKQWKQWLTLFFWAPKSLQMVLAAMKLKDFLLLGRKVITNLDSIFKSRDITLSTKVRLIKAMVFPVVMYGCESWTVKKAECQRIDAFELWCWRRLLRVWLDCKEIQPVHPKGDQSWVFTERTDFEAETPILWPHHMKSWLIWKDPDAGKDWRWEEKGTTRMKWFDGITDSMDMGLHGLQELVIVGRPGVLQLMGLQRVGHDWTNLRYELNWMPLTDQGNSLLCHYFCYYLKWVYDNEMFTIGNTLGCSYGGLGEEISHLPSFRAIRG